MNNDLVKVLVNDTYGGFGLSQEAIIYLYNKNSLFIEELNKDYVENLLNLPDSEITKDEQLAWYGIAKAGDKFIESQYTVGDYRRADPILIETIEEMGFEKCQRVDICKLKIIEVPVGIRWEVVSNESGVEYVREKSRKWT